MGFKGKADFKILRNSFVITILITFVNMLVSHNGNHVFFILITGQLLMNPCATE